jgi:short subunit dehydrogenase-like uncharacterized protein
MVWEIIDRARVRRSNWILSNTFITLEYGHNFQYSEGVSFSNFFIAAIHSMAIIIAEIMILFAPVRWILQILYPPGSGPSREMRKRGNFEINFVGEAENGEKAFVVVKADVEPKYQASAMMISEAALCLATDREKLGRSTAGFKKSIKGGVLTPASGLGMVLVERLRKAGMEFRLCQGLKK